MSKAMTRMPQPAASASGRLTTPARERPRALAAATLAVVVLGGCGGSSHSTGSQSSSSASTSASAPPSTGVASRNSRTVTGSAGGVRAKMHAGTHTPKAGRNWRVRFLVTRGGQRVTASVSYQFLFAGHVVARRSHYTFHGRFVDIVNWPSSAVGYPLTFRAVVTSGGASINLDYPVQVTR
jgi:hypothetical protein